MLKLLKNVVEEAAAIQLCTHLEADDAGVERPDGTRLPSVVAPATYPGRSNGDSPGPNISAVVDGEFAELWTTLDSVASQANRCEDALDEFMHARLDVPFPLIDIRISAEVLLHGLQAPHRSADAYFRVTDHAPYFDEIARMGKGQLRYEDDLTLSVKRFPTALVFGSWASFTNALARVPRVYRSNIDGITRIPRSIYEARHEESIIVRAKAMRRDPYLGGSADLYPAPNALDSKGWTLDKAEANQTELQKALKKAETEKKRAGAKSEKNPLSLASHGLGDIPPKKDGTIRGVRVDYCLQNSVISLAGLRGFHFPVQGEVTPQRDLAARSYLVALALLAHELSAKRGYFLRSGCSLVPTKATRQVIGSAGRASLPWDSDKPRVDVALELYRLAVADLVKHGISLEPRKEAKAEPKLIALLESNAKSQASAEEDEAAALV